MQGSESTLTVQDQVLKAEDIEGIEDRLVITFHSGQLMEYLSNFKDVCRLYHCSTHDNEQKKGILYDGL